MSFFLDLRLGGNDGFCDFEILRLRARASQSAASTNDGRARGGFARLRSAAVLLAFGG